MEGTGTIFIQALGPAYLSLNTNWDTIPIRLPDSLLERIKADAVQE